MGKRRTASPVRKAAAGIKPSRLVKHAEAQAAHHFGPWILAGVAPIPGQVLHMLATDLTVMIIIIGMLVLAGAALSLAAYHNNHDKSLVAQTHVLVTVGLIGAWLILCTVTGFVHLRYVGGWPLFPLPVPVQAPLVFWVIGGGTLAAAWNTRIGAGIARLRAAETEPERELDDWEEAGVGGVRGKIRTVNEYRDEGVLTLPKGLTLDDMQSNARSIESAHGWAPGSAQFLPAPELRNARKVRVIRMKSDPLEESPIWPGLQLKRGMTLFDPFGTGIRANGEIATQRVADKDGGKHYLVMGMTGSGKSYGEMPVLIHTAALGADTILIDTVKGIQSYWSVADVLQMYEIDEGRARAIIKKLLKKTLPDRTRFLSSEGLSSWSPKSKLKFLRVHIEEAWAVSDMDELTSLGVALRSAGGQLVVSLQRATYDQMPVTLRGQLGTRKCYGLMEDADEAFALSDRIIDALGSRPSDWGDTQPGMHILQQGGLTLAQQAMPVRTYTDQGSEFTFAGVAQTVGAKMPPMCPVTAKSLGILWDEHVAPVDLVRQHRGNTAAPAAQAASPNPGAPRERILVAGSTTYAQSQARVPEPRPGNDPGDVLEGEVLMSVSADGQSFTFGGVDIPDQTIRLDEPDPRPDYLPDPDDEIESQPTDRKPVVFGEAKAKASRLEFDAYMERTLAAIMADADHGPIKAADFASVVARTRWSRGSVYNRLKEWASSAGGPRLVETEDGNYLPVRDGASV